MKKMRRQLTNRIDWFVNRFDRFIHELIAFLLILIGCLKLQRRSLVNSFERSILVGCRSFDCFMHVKALPSKRVSKYDLARHESASSSVVRASDRCYGRPWVRFPLGTRIFSLSHARDNWIFQIFHIPYLLDSTPDPE